MIQYTIGREYRYPDSTQRFKLQKVKGWAFHFACGHWCTDLVFLDLIDCVTGIQVIENKQLSMFDHE